MHIETHTLHGPRKRRKIAYVPRYGVHQGPLGIVESGDIQRPRSGCFHAGSFPTALRDPIRTVFAVRTCLSLYRKASAPISFCLDNGAQYELTYRMQSP